MVVERVRGMIWGSRSLLRVAVLASALIFSSAATTWAQEAAGSNAQVEPPSKKDKKDKDKDKADKSGKKDKKDKGDKDKKATKSDESAQLESVPKDKTADIPNLTDKAKAEIIEGERFDFGEIWAGEPLKHTFLVKNVGTEPLEIVSVKPACGCTTTDSPKTIKPGETGQFTFTIKSQSLKGKFNKSVTVTTNQKDSPTIKFVMVGDAKQRIDVTPMSVGFGSIQGNEKIEKVVTITNNTEKPLELTLAEAQEKGEFTYELAEKEKGKVYELRVSTVPPLKEGSKSVTVLLKTNDEQQKTVDVRVAAVVPPRLSASPPAIIYNARLRNVPIRVINRGETDVKVTGVKVADSKIEAKVQENTAGKNYVVDLNFPEGFEMPDKEIEVVISTDDKEKPEIIVPVRPTPKPPVRPAEKLVGKKIPDFKLATVDNKSLTQEDVAKGKAPVVMNFFAGDCGFCKRQIPRLEKLRQDYESQGVRFINVAQKMRKEFTEAEIKDVLKSLEVNNMELAMDMANDIGKEFKVSSYPSLFVLGNSGKVEEVILGNAGTLELDLKKKLDALLKGEATTVSRMEVADDATAVGTDVTKSIAGAAADPKATTTPNVTPEADARARTNP